MARGEVAAQHEPDLEACSGSTEVETAPKIILEIDRVRLLRDFSLKKAKACEGC